MHEVRMWRTFWRWVPAVSLLSKLKLQASSQIELILSHYHGDGNTIPKFQINGVRSLQWGKLTCIKLPMMSRSVVECYGQEEVRTVVGAYLQRKENFETWGILEVYQFLYHWHNRNGLRMWYDWYEVWSIRVFLHHDYAGSITQNILACDRS